MLTILNWDSAENMGEEKTIGTYGPIAKQTKTKYFKNAFGYTVKVLLFRDRFDIINLIIMTWMIRSIKREYIYCLFRIEIKVGQMNYMECIMVKYILIVDILLSIKKTKVVKEK